MKHGVTHDLTRKSTQQALVQFILTFNPLLYPFWDTLHRLLNSSRKGLKNLERARHRERIACELAFFTVKLVEICLARGIYFSIENPTSSMLWELAPIKKLRLRNDTFEVEFPMCAYGAPYKKPTRLLTNCEALCSLQRTCGHKKHSQQLVGRVSVIDASGKRVSKNRTDLAGAYPHELTSVWGSVIDRACPFQHVEKINIGQLLANSTQICNKPLIHRRGVLNESSLYSKHSLKTSQSSNRAFCSDKIQQPSRRKRRNVKSESKPVSIKHGKKSDSHARRLDVDVVVPPNERLRASQVKPITLKRYAAAVAELDSWALSHHCSLGPKRADATNHSIST